jgi:exo-beta-1,3-glucanase (GH17 family)
MKSSSIFCISAIAASSLITLSSAALAISEPKSISSNLQSQSLQISAYSTQKIAEEPIEVNGRVCNPLLDPLCGWW